MFYNKGLRHINRFSKNKTMSKLNTTVELSYNHFSKSSDTSNSSIDILADYGAGKETIAVVTRPRDEDALSIAKHIVCIVDMVTVLEEAKIQIEHLQSLNYINNLLQSSELIITMIDDVLTKINE